jgi:hypothetical protein
MKFRGILLFAAGLLLGGLVIPVAAQGDPAENQLVIRSDGFIFLLRSGQRHLVSPVALSDEEINGYPEGEPYLSGLVPVEATTASPAGTFSGNTSGGTTATTNRPPPSPTVGSGTSASKPEASSSSIEADFKTLPTSVEQNGKLQVVITAPNGSSCEGKIQYKGGKTTPFTPSTTNGGECKMELTVPRDARLGEADVKAVVRVGAQSTEFEKQTEVVAAKR